MFDQPEITDNQGSYIVTMGIVVGVATRVATSITRWELVHGGGLAWVGGGGQRC